MKSNEIMGAVTEHWMDKRLRFNNPINLTGNLIRISSKDLLTLQEYKNQFLGINKSLADASEESKLKQEEYLY